MPHPARPYLAALLALAACIQSKERQVVQSNDSIEVGLRGQRDRLLEKADELRRLGRTRAALTIYESLVALYPDRMDVRAAHASARRALDLEIRSNAPVPEAPDGVSDRHENSTIDAVEHEHP